MLPGTVKVKFWALRVAAPASVIIWRLGSQHDASGRGLQGAIAAESDTARNGTKHGVGRDGQRAGVDHVPPW